MKITGANASVFFDGFDPEKIITYGSVPVLTEAGQWYFIMDTGAGSNFPYKGSVIKAPSAAGAQISLVAGDMIYPIDEERFCKTTASLSMEEGTVDVGDDCDPGASILDGIVQISGSLAGFFRYNDQTQEFDGITDNIINRFMDTIEDDGAGIYKVTSRNNGPAYLLICLNSKAKVGQIQHWLFIPVIISSVSTSFGNNDVQNKDISYSKAEGKAVHYKVPKAA